MNDDVKKEKRGIKKLNIKEGTKSSMKHNFSQCYRMPPKGTKRRLEERAATPARRGRKHSGGVTPEARFEINRKAREAMEERDLVAQEEEREERRKVRIYIKKKGKGREGRN